jgi:hypothetical protein
LKAKVKGSHNKSKVKIKRKPLTLAQKSNSL